MNGTDTDGTFVRNLRLWRYAEGDLFDDTPYIIRGLKVVPARQWDDKEWKYINRADGTKSLERTCRTAVEDVSHIVPITVFLISALGW